MRKILSLIILGVLLFASSASKVSAQTFDVLHDFRDTVLNGANPYYGPLLLRSGKLYGTTQVGGANSQGVIFSVNVDGSDFEVLHDFAQTGTNGAQPRGGVITDGTNLYGMTFAGGVDGDGVIYSVDLDGSDFEVLRSFTDGDAGDGMEPTGGLLLNAGRLYGMTAHGGANGEGIVFVIDTDGSDFEILYSFGGGTDGLNPIGSLVLNGSFLYGMTSEGGANGDGSIFRITTAGASYSVLHSFDGTDGDTPYGSLVVSDGTLYGMATLGGDDNFGVIFSVGLTGSNYSVLHHFEGTDGANPYGAPVLRNSVLYGTTYNGGTDSQGTVFSIDKDGSDFDVMHNFAASTLEGEGPYSTLAIDSSNGDLYGTTFEGGEYDDGIIFTLSGPSPTPTPGGGGSSHASSSGMGSCTGIVSQSTPELFQIDTTTSTATLYFVPVPGATNYVVSYGYGQNTKQYAVFTNLGASTGALVYKINDLAPSAEFSFMIAAQSGCAVGGFGNTMTVKTTSSGISTFYKITP